MQPDTKTYSREDIRNLWRRYKYEGDRQSGNEFATIANAQGQNYKTFQAEIDRECREEDMELRYESRANTRATLNSGTGPESSYTIRPRNLSREDRI